VNAEPVQGPGTRVGQIRVPHKIRAFAQLDALGLGGVVRPLEQAELDRSGVL
jgi:hypothetical protein